ncbi:MAG: radical SAM family heme chaperone HemW [Methylomonas sp.]|nr:radical SAM family heme chaperone HemW [Methylomonas sp.]
MPPLSLYLHFPWCIQKCPYCDFNSHAVKAGIPERQYVSALLADLDVDLALLPVAQPLHSIFMGGGTPSLFSPDALKLLLTGIRQRIDLSPDCEITLEANPGTFESAKFRAFRELGINRLSIGIQSFDDAHLKALGRVHDAAEARKAVEIARQSGFDNVNLDLMFGLPKQTLAEALSDVHAAIALQPSHISFYQLTLEPNTYFYKFPPKLPEDEAIFALQQACQAVLAEHGYVQYEISAYARAGYRCRHNLNYWQFGDYLGIGAGAHGKISLNLPNQILRTAKTKHPEHYLALKTMTNSETIPLAQLPLEFVMNHLRLKSGFTIDDFCERTGLTPEALEPALSSCIAVGLLIREDQRIYCSEKGWDFLDEILEKFIP